MDLLLLRTLLPTALLMTALLMTALLMTALLMTVWWGHGPAGPCPHHLAVIS
ncbi:hypothetical protein HC031_30185 [Planosporangium thailandense]|uniref:Uncharacterized protein n=1 Tax=Planosporangium thailandense TaxID=765197 RepID=A0ABX0Y6B1_9ACTN|nr:hypothetical protein [Planosporangium thailandense]NJC73951.1 hypothetical protein [Planosporangium thailandense]